MTLFPIYWPLRKISEVVCYFFFIQLNITACSLIRWGNFALIIKNRWAYFSFISLYLANGQDYAVKLCRSLCTNIYDLCVDISKIDKDTNIRISVPSCFANAIWLNWNDPIYFHSEPASWKCNEVHGWFVCMQTNFFFQSKLKPVITM